MTLYLIGLGLGDEKDISLKGLEAVKKCSKIYLENYTSLLQCSLDKLEKLYGQKVFLAPRDLAEQDFELILKEAKNKEIAFLVIGDPFSATTHAELFKQARMHNITIEVIHNASILTAIGLSGLQLYKFGRKTSLPFPENVPNLETPYHVLKENLSSGLHTLFLLDLNPEKNKFMSVKQALEILLEIEKRKKENIITQNTVAVGCARLGTNNFIIKSGSIKKLKSCDFGKPPHCLIIPGKLHFQEEEMLKLWGLD